MNCNISRVIVVACFLMSCSLMGMHSRKSVQGAFASFPLSKFDIPNVPEHMKLYWHLVKGFQEIENRFQELQRDDGIDTEPSDDLTDAEAREIFEEMCEEIKCSHRLRTVQKEWSKVIDEIMRKALPSERKINMDELLEQPTLKIKN